MCFLSVVYLIFLLYEWRGKDLITLCRYSGGRGLRLLHINERPYSLALFASFDGQLSSHLTNEFIRLSDDIFHSLTTRPYGTLLSLTSKPHRALFTDLQFQNSLMLYPSPPCFYISSSPLSIHDQPNLKSSCAPIRPKPQSADILASSPRILWHSTHKYPRFNVPLLLRRKLQIPFSHPR